MTPEAQQRAICKALGRPMLCGYSLDDHLWPKEWQAQNKPFPFHYRQCERCPALHIEGERNPTWDDDKIAPNYLSDLDAMQVAEKTLERPNHDDEQVELNIYAEILRRISLANRNHYTFQATAEQRAEAFLRAIGKWVEETENQPC